MPAISLPTGGNDLGPPGVRTGFLDLIVQAQRHARNYTAMGRWLQRKGEMLHGDGVSLAPGGSAMVRRVTHDCRCDLGCVAPPII